MHLDTASKSNNYLALYFCIIQNRYLSSIHVLNPDNFFDLSDKTILTSSWNNNWFFYSWPAEIDIFRFVYIVLLIGQSNLRESKSNNKFSGILVAKKIWPIPFLADVEMGKLICDRNVLKICFLRRNFCKFIYSLGYYNVTVKLGTQFRTWLDLIRFDRISRKFL